MFRNVQFLPISFLIRSAVVVIALISLFDGIYLLPVPNNKVNAAVPFLTTCSPPCVQNFDNVFPPALPTGWSTILFIGQTGDLPWATTSAASAFRSFPRSAFASDPPHTSDNRLLSPTFAISSIPAVLTFERKNDLEQNFDGMVLEISINGAAFVDILSVGGSFASGGYNGTIIGSGNLSGQSAWTGTTSDFISTTVILPASVNGKSVRFQWRVSTDFSIGGGGAFIDSFKLTETPPNDHLRNAQTIAGASGTVQGNNEGATKESGEPNHAGDSGGSSVWYRWVAPSTGRFTFTTFRSSFNTLLGIYTGDNFPVTTIASNDNSNDEGGPCRDGSSIASFNAVAGVVYKIAVDRKSPDPGGNITLRWGRSASISGRITNAGGGGVLVSVIRLQDDICRDGGFSTSNFTFNDVPTGGRYSIVFSVPGEFYTRWGTTDSISPLSGDVSNFNFYRISPAANIVGTVTMPGGDTSDLTVRCVSTPEPLASQPAFFLGAGKYQCSALPVFANYHVTPTKVGFTFSPPFRPVFLLTSGVIGVDFTGTADPLRTISGRVIHPNGITGIGGVSVALIGSQTASRVTDSDGNYSFANVLNGGNYTVTPSSPNAAFTPASQSFNNVTSNQSANFTATFSLQLILDESGLVTALDSMLLTRDPLPVINTTNVFNRGVDRNTRVVIFVSNFQLGANEPPSSVVINLVGSNGQTYDIPAEDVRPAANQTFSQVVFRLPDTLTPGTCTLLVKARGLSSNIGMLRIKG